VFLSNCDFRRIAGFDPSEFWDGQDYLNLQQYIFDDAQKTFALTDPLRGFIDHVYVRDNRFYGMSDIGVSFYRVSWVSLGSTSSTRYLAQVQVLEQASE
jgi:hypothetical protein